MNTLSTLKKKQAFTITVLFALLILLVVTVIVRHNEANQTPPAFTAPKTALVHITEDGFAPQTALVSAGTVVIWSNSDTAPHHVAAGPYTTHNSLPGLDSKSNIDVNGTYRFTFTKPGTYQYQDELHPTTTGTIIVK